MLADHLTREKTEALVTTCYLDLYTTSHFIIMKVFELSVKAQGEGEFSRLGTLRIMNARGLSCSEATDPASVFSSRSLCFPYSVCAEYF